MTKRRVIIFLTALCLTVVAATSGSATGATSTPPSGAAEVKHIVVIVEQNHTYDSYFGAYPGGDGAYVGGARVSQPSTNGKEVISEPIRTRDFIRYRPKKKGTTALSNTSGAALAAYHGGGMDSFVRAQQRRGKPAQLPLLHADGSTVSGLWGLANSYVLFDRYFSSVPGGSLPNMISLLTGKRKGYAGSGDLKDLTRFAKSDTPTVFDQLAQRNIPWRYYVGQLPLLKGNRVIDGSYLKKGATPSVLYTAPVLAMPRFWRQPLRAGLSTQDQFYKDASTGSLPAVSVVAPLPSDQPMTSLEASQERLLSMINTLTKGPEWSKTAVFVVWDDWGGWYDHVAPPATGGLLGFRVPALLVSPLVRQGYISGVAQDHRSVLAFVARQFGLPDLTGSNARGDSFDNAFRNPPKPDRRGIIRLTRLPAPPVGTNHQNALALLSYALVLGTVTLAGGAWAVTTWRRRHAARPDVLGEY